jgi:hypothetical protein
MTRILYHNPRALSSGKFAGFSPKSGLDKQRALRYSRDVIDKRPHKEAHKMATISIWRGYRDWDAGSDYEVVTYEDARELGAVRFEDADSDIQYRIIQWDEGIVVFFVERKGYYCEAEIYEYDSIDAAAKDYSFILKKAGVI